MTSVELEPGNLSYATFDQTAEDVLRLAAPPTRIEVAGVEVPRGEGDDTYDETPVVSGGVVVRLRRTQGGEVGVTLRE